MNDAPPARPRKEKLCVLVDSCGLQAAMQERNAKVDYKRLKDWLARQREVSILRYYSCEPPNVSQSRVDFYNVLKRAGYELQLHPVLTSLNDDEECATQSLCHAEMVWDMCELIITGRFDTIVIVAGSATFTNIVSRVRRKGVDVKIVFFDENCDPALKSKGTAFRHINLDAVNLRK